MHQKFNPPIHSTLHYYLSYQAKMVEIFTDLHATYKNIPSRMKAESFKQRVVSCFKAWEVRKTKSSNQNTG